MRKKIVWILVLVLIAALCAVLLLTYDFGRQPFQGLNAEDLADVQIHVIAGTRDFPAEVDNFQPLVELLREVRIYGETDLWQNLSGGNTVLELTYRDGRETTLYVLGRFFVIDGTGYAARYKPCAALSEYARDLVNLR